MVDKSRIPCKTCGHKKNRHSSSYDICWSCPVNKYNNVGYCKFEQLDNLPYVEWVYEQKGETI